jgi:hypothetical protein
MTMTGWTLTNLTEDQLRILTASEQTLGVGYLLVYRPSERPDGSPNDGWLRSLQTAPLTQTQLEHLYKLETLLQATVVAYIDTR